MPKITGSSLEDHRQRTQERIFAALEQLLHLHGYDSITLADIAARAKIGRTVMYNYYPDKQSLLLDFAGRETDDYRSRLEVALAGTDNPVEQLQLFIRMQLRQLTTQHIAPGSLRTVLTDAGHERMLEHVAPLAGILRDILMRAQGEQYLPDDDIDVLLPLVSASISGRNTVDLQGRSLDLAIEATTTFVLRGLGAQLDELGQPRRLGDPEPLAVG